MKFRIVNWFLKMLIRLMYRHVKNTNLEIVVDGFSNTHMAITCKHGFLRMVCQYNNLYEYKNGEFYTTPRGEYQKECVFVLIDIMHLCSKIITKTIRNCKNNTMVRARIDIPKNEMATFIERIVK